MLNERDIGIVMFIELIVSIIGLLTIYFMTSTASDAMVVCLVMLIVIGIVKLFRNGKDIG